MSEYGKPMEILETKAEGKGEEEGQRQTLGD